MKKLILALCLISSQSLAATLHAPGTMTDGAPLNASDIKHYIIEYNRVTRSTMQSAGIIVIPPKTSSIRAKTVLMNGVESNWSNELIFIIKPSPPRLTKTDGAGI